METRKIASEKDTKMQFSLTEVSAVPLEKYQEDLIYVRRKQVVCPHDNLEIHFAEQTVQCKDCERRWE